MQMLLLWLILMDQQGSSGMVHTKQPWHQKHQHQQECCSRSGMLQQGLWRQQQETRKR
jgi:hypothetical protein